MTSKKQINRIKIILVEKNRTHKWLSEKTDQNRAKISRWCTNDMQPSLEMLVEIAEFLDVDVRELLVPTKND